MDCVPSFDLVSPLFLSDFIQEDEMMFLRNLQFQDSSISNLTTDNVIGGDRKRKSSRRFKMGEAEKEDGGEQSKKMKHRDVERQRRQELSTLLKSLRCLLPLEYIKGKRSASDHVQEAVNYIKDLENRIKELGDKRDGIKRLFDLEERVPGSSSSSTEECCSSSSCSCPDQDPNSSNSVMVMPCLAGVEVVIRSCLRHKFCLSSVLQVLTQEQGLDVLKCTSTKLQGRFIHTIVCQVDEGRKINFSEIAEKIMKTNT